MERFIRAIVYTAITAEVVLALALTVIGGSAEGWLGVFIMLCGLSLLIHLLYRYNKPYR